MNNNQQNVYVWDICIRIFHWSLVVSFITTYFTSEEKNEIHIFHLSRIRSSYREETH